MERNRLARQIIDTCLEMTRLGLNQGTAGNVSVRYQGGMLITPTGIPYEKLTEANGVFIRRPTRRDPMPRRWSTITLSIVRRCRSSTGPSRPSTI